MKNPYQVIRCKHVTEKTQVLKELSEAQSNKSLQRFDKPKEVFIVDINSNKKEIADAIEEIYKEQKVKVLSVNTIVAKPKPKRRGRGRPGCTKKFKKAIVTLEKGDTLEEI